MLIYLLNTLLNLTQEGSMRQQESSWYWKTVVDTIQDGVMIVYLLGHLIL